MNVERFTRNDLVRYRVHSDYDGDSIATTPKELLTLLRWLQEHEQEIINDQIANMTHEAESEASMPYTDEEIRHARELLEHGGTEITDLVRRALEEGETTNG